MGEQRIGYRVRIPCDACSVTNVIAVIIDEAGLMAVPFIPQIAE